MTIASFANVLSIFSGAELSSEKRRELVEEALLMTLARATSADTNIKPVEVGSVQAVFRKATGEEVSEADIRVAAKSEIFETTSLDKALAKLSHKLEPGDRVLIAQSLAEVIKSDREVSEFESEFFDKVAGALRIRPSELAGLIPRSN